MPKAAFLVICAALFAAGLATATIRADPPAPPLPTTTTTATTEQTATDTATVPTQTAITASSTTTAAVATSTTATTVATASTATIAPPPPPTPTTLATPTATTSRAPPPAAHPQPERADIVPSWIESAGPLEALPRQISGTCLLVGLGAVLTPGEPSRVIGTPVGEGAASVLRSGPVAYPGSGAVLAVRSSVLHAIGCRAAGEGVVSLDDVSVFGGEISAQKVELTIDRRARGRASSVVGLQVDGSPVASPAGAHRAVGDWGSLVVLPPPRLLAGLEASALAVHLLRAHDGYPAGTVLLIAFAGGRTPAAGLVKRSVPRLRPATPPRKRPSTLDQPLHVTPPLGLPSYVFPIAGQASYVDTYGAFRSDVQGNWHHGDDIFARLGAPVVAVADGTLNRVGWEKLGGWRLWVRDRLGNEFYYAHLAGYSRQALDSTRVRAGEVIGFLGNTGDAFTTSPHLHFEVHPRSLLRLEYDGAVDPTSYLDHWRHLEHVAVPRPVHPRFPTGQVRRGS